MLGGMRRELGGGRLTARAGAVRELLEELAERADGAATWLFADPTAAERRLHEDLRVLVNGRSIEFLEGLDTRVGEADRVTLHHTGARGYPGG